MQNGSVFVDTNVFIYSRDHRAPEKQRRAKEWLSALAKSGAGRVNLQVINELTRWLLANEPRMSLAQAREQAAALQNWGNNPISWPIVELAWDARARFGYQWFDCLLLGASVAENCRFFLTEDLVHGVEFGTICIINPFKTTFTELHQE
jgi:predicted nucleic acid-binding protein